MRKTTISMLLLTLVFPSSLAAGDTVGPAPIARKDDRVRLKNVELSEAGELSGQLLNKSGLALPTVGFSIEQANGIQEIETGTNGRFTVKGLSSGRCVIRVEDDVFACRVWKRGTAPPNSLKTMALVASTDVVRGQIGIPLPMLPLPIIPLPALPLPPLPGIVGGLGGGSLMGVTLLAVGGGVIAVAASDDDSPNASL